MIKDYGGVINDLVAGQWEHPVTGKKVTIDIRSIIIKETIEGMEGSLVAPLHENQKLAVVSDEFTHDVLGRRVNSALRAEGSATEEIIWKNPKSTIEKVEELRHLTRNCDGLIAVGSGTINDSVKYAAFLDKKSYSVFPTSPQNAYTTPTASISFGGFKKSLSCHPAQGVFFDLAVVSKCPIRLTRSAFADVICRTTAQVDWLMSHLLFDTAYRNAPYILLEYDENTLFENTLKLKQGDIESFGMLIRICALMGLGTNFANTTHSGSMAEHMISHYIDMFAGDAHPGTLHGEQVGAGTLTMSRLQNRILSKDTPPLLNPTQIDEAGMLARYGEKVGRDCIEQLKQKSLDAKKADAVNQQLAREWDQIAGRLRQVLLPFDQMWRTMDEIGAPKSGSELGLPSEFYREAVLHAREIRDRFTMLDVAGDAGMLEAFAAECE
jgi:glycerol-1-phosphate dehydrogenase [NAD(P)+]